MDQYCYVYTLNDLFQIVVLIWLIAAVAGEFQGHGDEQGHEQHEVHDYHVSVVSVSILTPCGVGTVLRTSLSQLSLSLAHSTRLTGASDKLRHVL